MSSSSSDASQASTSDNGDAKRPATPKSRARRSLKHVVQTSNAQDILLFLVAFRLLNALTVNTFFQPDEYFQSLEPAWALAFGLNSGAWITWEWKNQLRSAIHPAIFAGVYWSLDAAAKFLHLSPSLRGDLLLAGPKALQAFLAALSDYYTWKLSGRIYGEGSSTSWAALALTIISPWQWFCSTRTFSNSLETTLTIGALYNWPWHWSQVSEETPKAHVDKCGLRIRNAGDSSNDDPDETTSLRRALLLAAFATILRPTNILIWAGLAWLTFVKTSKSQWLLNLPWTEKVTSVPYLTWSLAPSPRECLAIIENSVLCGSAGLVLSVFVDRLFYGMWTFPPVNFLYFNVVQSLAIFYGNNDWHYYLSQGYPLLLTTALPFTVTAIYQTLAKSRSCNNLSPVSRIALKNLAIISLVVPVILSIISHKEVRFIYPLLPPLHILTAFTLSSYFAPALLQPTTHPKLQAPFRLTKRIVLVFIVAINLAIALFTTTSHNSGIIEVTHYLRNEFITHHLMAPAQYPHPPTNMTVGFLMPCHSTPWRSHLQFPPNTTHPGISAWALTCEPPLHLTPTQKLSYLDEADVFYANPSSWLRRNMVRKPPIQRKNAAAAHDSHLQATYSSGYLSRKREWPAYLIFFEQLESVITTNLRGSGYGECKRLPNSLWHDDSRRKGDVVVWCLDPETQQAVRDAKTAEEDRLATRKARIDQLRDAIKNNGSGAKSAIKSLADQIHLWTNDLASRLHLSADPEVIKEPKKTPFHTRSPALVPGTARADRVERVVEKPFWRVAPLLQPLKRVHKPSFTDRLWAFVPDALTPQSRKRSKGVLDSLRAWLPDWPPALGGGGPGPGPGPGARGAGGRNVGLWN